MAVAVALIAVAVPSTAFGAETVGSNLAGSPNGNLMCSPSACMSAHETLPASSQAPGGVVAQSDGIVVRWRIKVGVTTGPVALRITRPGDSDTRAGAGTGPTVTPATNQTSSFEVRLPIQAGDALGIDCCQDVLFYPFAETTDAVNRNWFPPLVDGDPARPGAINPADAELLVNADVEPDADRDGFGDETQDQCPTDASTQGECPVPPVRPVPPVLPVLPVLPDTDPPETTITKDPHRIDKHKFRFQFISDEPDSTFECTLDRKPFKPCAAPTTVKRLDEGKHKFKVRATDAAGNVDPSPDKDKFRVVD